MAKLQASWKSALTPQKAPTYGNQGMLITSPKELQVSNVDYAVVFEGTKKYHIAIADVVNPYTLHVVIPEHDIAEEVVVKVYTCQDNHLNILTHLKFTFISQMEHAIAKFLAQSASNAEVAEKIDTVWTVCLGKDHLELWDKRLAQAFAQLELPIEWTLVGDILQKENESHQTLLHFAAHHGLKELINVLLNLPGAKQALSTCNKSGLLPRDVARENGRLDIAELLDSERSSDQRKSGAFKDNSRRKVKTNNENGLTTITNLKNHNIQEDIQFLRDINKLRKQGNSPEKRHSWPVKIQSFHPDNFSEHLVKELSDTGAREEEKNTFIDDNLIRLRNIREEICNLRTWNAEEAAKDISVIADQNRRPAHSRRLSCPASVERRKRPAQGLPNLKSRPDNGNAIEPRNPETSEMVFSTPPNSPPLGLLVDLASPTVTSEDTFAPLEDAPEPFMTPLSNTPSPPTSSPLPISLKYSEVEKRHSDVVKGRPRTWYGGSGNILTGQNEELRRSNSLEDFAKALASASDDESLASATSEANSKEGLLNTLSSFVQKESRTASFVSSTSDISVGKESVESDAESQHGDDYKHGFTQEDINGENVKNIDEYQGIQEYTGSSKQYEEIENVDNPNRDEVNVLGDDGVHLENQLNGENAMNGITEERRDVYNENANESEKLGTSDGFGQGWTMKTVNDITAGSNVENNEDENKCKDAVHECGESEHESRNMEHECRQTDNLNHSDTELESGDTEYKSKDVEQKGKDSEQKCKDTEEKCEDAEEKCEDAEEKCEDMEEEYKDTEEEYKDTEKKSKDAEESCKNTGEEYKGTEEEYKDTEKKSKDTEESCKNTGEECKGTEEEYKDTEKKSKDTEELCQNTGEECKGTEEEYKDTEKKSKDTEESYKNTEEECKGTSKESEDTEEESRDTEEKSKDTEEECKDTEGKSKNTEEKSKNTVEFQDKSEDIEDTMEAWQDKLAKEENKDHVDSEHEPISDTKATADRDITEDILSHAVEQEDLQNLDSKPHENTHNVERSIVCNEVGGDAEKPKSVVKDAYIENKDEGNENVRSQKMEEMETENENVKEELSNDNEESKLKTEDQYKELLDDTVVQCSDISISEVIEDQPKERQHIHKDKPVENLSEETEHSQASGDNEIFEENGEITGNGPERSETSPEGDAAETKDLKESNESIILEEKYKNRSIESGNVAEGFEGNLKVAQARCEHSEGYPTEPDVRVSDPDIGPDDGEETKIKYEDLNDIECEVIDFCLPGQNTERSAELFRIQATHDVESGDDSDHDKHIQFDKKARSVMPQAEERSPTNLEETFSGLAFRQRSAVLLGVKAPVKRSGSDVSVTSLQDVQFDMHVNDRDGDLSSGVLNSSRKAKSFGDLSTFSDNRADTTKDDGEDSEDERKRIQEDHSVISRVKKFEQTSKFASNEHLEQISTSRVIAERDDEKQGSRRWSNFFYNKNPKPAKKPGRTPTFRRDNLRSSMNSIGKGSKSAAKNTIESLVTGQHSAAFAKHSQTAPNLNVTTGGRPRSYTRDSPNAVRKLPTDPVDSEEHKPESPEEVEMPNEDLDLEVDSDLENFDEEPEAWSVTVEKDLLKKMKKNEIKRQDVILELIQTEGHHVRTLKIMQQVFYRGLFKFASYPAERLDELFPRINDLVDISARFHRNLRCRQDESAAVRMIGDVIVKQFSGDNGELVKHAYGEFVSKHSEAVALYKHHFKTDKKFASFIKKCHGHRIVRRLSVPECFTLVTQRMTKYPLLIEAILKVTKSNTTDYKELQKALLLVKDATKSVDNAIKDYEKQCRLKDIKMRMEKGSVVLKGGLKLKNSRFVDYRSRMIHNGILQWKNARGKLTETHVVLLESMVAFLQENDKKFSLLSIDGKSPCIALKTLMVREVATDKCAIYFVSTSKKGPEMYEFVCNSQKEKRQWYAIITDAISKAPEDTGDLFHSPEEEKRLTEERLKRRNELLEIMNGKDQELSHLVQEKNKLVSEMKELWQMLEGNEKTKEDERITSNIKARTVLLKIINRTTQLTADTVLIHESHSDSEIAATTYDKKTSSPKRAETFGGFDRRPSQKTPRRTTTTIPEGTLEENHVAQSRDSGLSLASESVSGLSCVDSVVRLSQGQDMGGSTSFQMLEALQWVLVEFSRQETSLESLRMELQATKEDIRRHRSLKIENDKKHVLMKEEHQAELTRQKKAYSDLERAFNTQVSELKQKLSNQQEQQESMLKNLSELRRAFSDK